MSFDKYSGWGARPLLPAAPSPPKRHIADAIAGSTAEKLEALHVAMEALTGNVAEIDARTQSSEKVLGAISDELAKSKVQVQETLAQIQSTLRDITSRLDRLTDTSNPATSKKDPGSDESKASGRK